MRVHVLAIHGIGYGRRPGFSRHLRDMVVRELERRGSGSAPRARERIDHFWREVVWDQDEAAEELYRRVGDPVPGWARELLRRLGWPTPRQLACYSVGDILVYYSQRPQVWDKVWREVQEIVNEHQEKGTHELYLALVGHSMGSVVAFDFLHVWQREEGPHTRWRVAHSRPGTLQVRAVADEGPTVIASGLFTLGSPLALFYRLSGAREHQYRDPVPFRLADGWWNFYDQEDMVSFPLQGIFGPELVRDVVVDNFPMPIIGFLRAHGGYWRSRRVAEAIADHVHRMEDEKGAWAR